MGTGDTDVPFDQRGWSSPHGEPCRPLGRPDLSLKFSPRIADGSNLLQNAHRMKVFEGKDAGDKGNKAGSELRHTTGVHSHSVVGGSGGSSGPGSASRSGLFEMFPLNFANKKRPLDERQVKLAHRLYVSTTNYSPSKVRGLRRNLQNHHFEQQHHDATLPLNGTELDHTQQPSFRQGDESVELLRYAIRECSSRLWTVKNGASFLDQVPSSELLDLLHLQEEYHRERAQTHTAHETLNSPRAAGGAGAKFKTFHQLHDDSKTPGFNDGADIEPHDPEFSGRPQSSADNSDDFYLPYTTRRPQRSPHKQLPTLSEFKSRAREEKTPRPLLSLHSSSTEIASGSSPLSGRRHSVRGSQISGVMGLHLSPSKVDTTPSSSPIRVSLVPPSGNSPLVNPTLHQMSENTTALDLELLPSATRGRKKHSPPRAVAPQPLRSVERLQAAVDAIDATKRSHSKVLAKTVDSLNQNRRDCMTIKYKHFVVQHHLDDDIQHMRSASEAQRTEAIEDTWHRNAWYRGFLKHLLTRDAPLRPAEAFLVRAAHCIANDSHTFDPELLFRLLLLLHRDDLLVREVQHMLALLRQALHVTLDEWELFFAAHGLPEPVEVCE